MIIKNVLFHFLKKGRFLRLMYKSFFCLIKKNSFFTIFKRTRMSKSLLLRITLLLTILLTLTKFTAYILTKSDAILTDALESIANVVAGIFATFSLYLASRPKDENHPYGHGKIEFLSVGLEGGLIIMAGMFMVVEILYAYIHPHKIDHLGWGITLTIVSTVVNFTLAYFLIQKATNEHSHILLAEGKHIQADAFTSVGLIFGLGALYLTGWQWLDGSIAMMFALLNIRTGYFLLKEAVSGIMDEANRSLLENLILILQKNRKREWIDFHNLRIIQYGESIHIDCHLTLPYYLDLETAHNHLHEVEELVAREHSCQTEIFIHTDPCLPKSCPLCAVENCAFRTSNFQNLVEWNFGNMVKNEKHFIEKG